jgi:hypothetical protein
MNAGFSTLKLLKAHLLAEVLREDTSYDAAITAIGQGIAAQFESFCNRKFMRVVDDEAVFSADREVYVLPRYPVEAITSAKMQFTLAGGYEDQSLSLVQQLNYASGLLHFGGTLGGPADLVKITYTGGYFWNQNEAGVDALPEDATALPADIQTAWLQHCEAVWDMRDKLGTGIAGAPKAKQALGELELLPLVKQMLQGRIRYQLT